MSTQPNDRAYPSVEYGDCETSRPYTSEYGVTKRELFAAMAMQGILANPFLMEVIRKVANESHYPDKVKVSKSIYLTASNMALKHADYQIAMMNDDTKGDDK